MVGSNQTFAEGASINRPPLFTDDKGIWESVDRGIWDAVLNGPFVPLNIDNEEQEPKTFAQWTADENRRAQYDVKARNIISSALTLDEFYRISVCTSAREMWEILRVTHEGTDEVKRARKNSLIQQYEIFRMQ